MFPLSPAAGCLNLASSRLRPVRQWLPSHTLDPGTGLLGLFEQREEAGISSLSICSIEEYISTLSTGTSAFSARCASGNPVLIVGHTLCSHGPLNSYARKPRIWYRAGPFFCFPSNVQSVSFTNSGKTIRVTRLAQIGAPTMHLWRLQRANATAHSSRFDHETIPVCVLTSTRLPPAHRARYLTCSCGACQVPNAADVR